MKKWYQITTDVKNWYLIVTDVSDKAAINLFDCFNHIIRCKGLSNFLSFFTETSFE